MSQGLINQYLNDLDRLKKIGGTHRELVVREAFKDLIKGWGKQHDLLFIPEYKLDSATKAATRATSVGTGSTMAGAAVRLHKCRASPP